MSPLFPASTFMRLGGAGLLAMVLAVAGCPKPENNDCQAGTKDCPCDNNACGSGLECQGGTCRETGCPEGAQNCPCRTDSSCDNVGGTQLVCEAGTCRSPNCVAGTLNCPCATGRTCTGMNVICDASSTCVEQPPVCTPGGEGCPCAANNRCGINEHGEQLSCQNNRCEVEACPPGGTGCACATGNTCTVSGDVCRQGFCRPGGCVPGELNCECAGGSCNGASLTCREGLICVDNTGTAGGLCRMDGTCDPGSRCQSGYCLPCTLGTQGCACTASRSCTVGTVCNDANVCAVAGVDAPPANPRCYTACEQDAVDDGGVLRTCSTEGLMAGCVGGRDCVEGSCVLPGEQPRACTGELDCPRHQTCIENQCYSNCESDVECHDGNRCNMKVCRAPCGTGQPECGAGRYCALGSDAENGFCLTAAPATGSQTGTEGTFELSTTNIELSNVKDRTAFRITNQSPSYQVFRVRKRSQNLIRQEGDPLVYDDPEVTLGDGGVSQCDPATNCPLTWLQMGPQGTLALTQKFDVGIEGGASVTVELANAGGVEGVRWEGTLEVTHARFGKRTINMTYVERPEGQWTGTMYYFSTFGDADMAPWRNSRNYTTTTEQLTNLNAGNAVKNALIQKWSGVRHGRVQWEDFIDILMSTRTGSWKQPGVQQKCLQGEPVGSRKACYLTDKTGSGVAPYSDNVDSFPIPSGLTELPISMNLKLPPVGGDQKQLTGRIESAKALQYAGNPAVTLAFSHDPNTCSTDMGLTFNTCLTFLSSMQANVYVGGRYIASATDGTCSAGSPVANVFQRKETPWLLPGFERATHISTEPGNLRVRYECVDTEVPFVGPPANPDLYDSLNKALAKANPIPDGRARMRELKLVDGALINQSKLFIIFEEQFSSFLDATDTEGFKAYGYMMLERAPTTLEDDAFEGSAPQTPSPRSPGLLNTQCSQEILDAIDGDTSPGDPDGLFNVADDPARVVSTILFGVDGTASPEAILATDNEKVHYFCEDTGLFDGGKNNRGGTGLQEVSIPCPAGSNVVFFTVNGLSQGAIADLSCQNQDPVTQKGSCGVQLDQWRNQPGYLVQDPPFWRCTSDNEVFCDFNRNDLRAGKTFFRANSADKPSFNSLRTDIDQAFRYKTRFVSRDGSTVGFTPTICQQDSDRKPYCYDPLLIEDLRKRVDCLVDVWQTAYPMLPNTPTQTGLGLQDELAKYLRINFSEDAGALGALATDGFERMYAELLIMLGDESYTAAFASRFDLANSRSISFPGDKFEENGFSLSGIPGYEMYNLYQAAQYYQETMDRFYDLSPIVWDSIQFGASQRNFITEETVVRYFERLIRASTQKSKAWSEVARRYQGFNRPDLARRVVERAYTAMYMESVVLSRMMLRIVTSTLNRNPQVLRAMDDAALRYSVASLEMRNVYRNITDGTTFFGYAPEFVPLPALDPRDNNAFELVLLRANDKVRAAREREDLALSSGRSFDVDAAEFQAELTRVRNNYENQLGEVCGTFVADVEGDTAVYPAITKYAHRNKRAQALGQPCGLMGNGNIHRQMAEMEIIQLEVEQLIRQFDNVVAEVAIERERVNRQCELIGEQADYVYTMNGVETGIKLAIQTAGFVKNRLQRGLDVCTKIAETKKCIVLAGTSAGSDCPIAAIAAFEVGLAWTSADAAIAVTEGAVIALETSLAQVQAATARWQTLHQCDVALVDSDARTKVLLLRIKELEIEMLKADRRLNLAISDIEKARNDALRIELEQSEAEQLSIDVAAARNDPNIRIYKNDAIINADFSFFDAAREAYRLTKIYEYYTSQSYPELQKLFLARMVARGEYNLENYVVELSNAFARFEEDFGNPDTRVAVFSLRDDILQVPRREGDGADLSEGERIANLRRRLADVNFIDESGYLSFPFSTTVAQLSPLTRNHKVLYAEAEIIGGDTGDPVGRVYLRQRGTGVVRTLDGERDFYRMPDRTAVINPFFNGQRIYTQEVYRNARLRDRPFINTSWQLVLNQRDETENRDINLQSLTDIRLYLFYTDFTAF